MRKNFLLIMALICLHAFGQINERATAFEFPFQPGDAQWKSFSSPQERIAALQIPEAKLKTISTNNLLNVCLDFPYSMDMLAYDYPEVGFDAICKEFNGYRELLTRQDLADALLKKCEAIPDVIESILNKDELTKGDYSFKCYILFYMMGIDEVTSSLDAEQSAKFTTAIREATTKMKAYPDIFGMAYNMGIKRIPGPQRTYDYELNPTTRTIPNGYSVAVGKLKVSDLPSSQKEANKNYVETRYNVEVISESTKKYNCHAYAWYMKSVPHNDPVWMSDPRVYWETGCYYEVPENEAEVVLYYDTLDPYYGNWHSAIRINDNEYISKWGELPLVKHSLTNVHENYGKSRKYYKLYEPQMIGPDSLSSVTTYSIEPLPPGYSVTWSLSDKYYSQKHMKVENNMCTLIQDPRYNMDNATLTATIKYNNNIAKTLTKTISSHSSYSGFYILYKWSGEEYLPLYNPYLIYIEKGNYGNWLYINSPFLIGADITSTGNITPTRWDVDKQTGTIIVGIPTTTDGYAIVIDVTCTNGDKYQIVILRGSTSRGLSLGMDGTKLNIGLINDNACVPSDKMSSIYAQQIDEELEWTLEVYDAVTNRMVYVGKMAGMTASLDTSNWKPGIHIVRATIGDQTLSKKILIK